MCIVCVGLGTITTIFYVVTVKEPSLSKKATDRELNYRRALGLLDESVDSQGEEKKKKTACDWMSQA